MKNIEIKFKGKTYECEHRRQSAEHNAEMARLQRLFFKDGDMSAAYKIVAFATGIPEDELRKLSIDEILDFWRSINKLLKKNIRLDSH